MIDDKSFDFFLEGDFDIDEFEDYGSFEDDESIDDEDNNRISIEDKTPVDISVPTKCWSNHDLYANPDDFKGHKEDKMSNKDRFARLMKVLPARTRNSSRFNFERFGYREDQVKDSKPNSKVTVQLRNIRLADYDTELPHIPATVVTVFKNKRYYCYAAITIGENIMFFRETLHQINHFVTAYSIPIEVLYLYRNYHATNLTNFKEKWVVKRLVDRRMARTEAQLSKFKAPIHEAPPIAEHPTDLELKMIVEDFPQEESN